MLPSPFGTAAAQGLPPAPLAAQSMDFQALLGVQQQQQQAAQVVVGMAAPPAFHPQYSAFLAEAQGAEAPKASRPPTGRRGKVRVCVCVRGWVGPTRWRRRQQQLL